MTLEALLTEAEAHFPALAPARQRLRDHLTVHLARGVPLPRHLEDYLLTVACVLGEAGALEALERHVLSTVRGNIARVLGPGAACEDVLQNLRRKLLVSVDGAPAKLVNYTGAAPLRSWVRTIAVRMALEARSQEQGRLSEPLGGDVYDSDRNLELQLLKAEHGPRFKAAFEGAFSTLEVRDRALLRLHFLNGVSLERLGGMYGAHKSTLSRRLARIRLAILEALRAQLSSDLRLNDQELDSLLRELGSQLSISIPAE